MDSFAGRTLTHYEVLEKLGEGGMGVVYKARDTRLNRLVAIKVLPPDKTADPARRARFFQEAQTASALNHPNIVTIHEIDRHADCDFIVMELVPGRTLDAAIGRGLKLGDTLKFAIQTADALTAAHRAGIVHRDLKPGNVMVTDSGNVKVLDFGLAKLTEAAVSADDETRTVNAAAPPLTERGAIVGTVAYMSPEQAEGKTVDARSDIFSFGSLLYEMVTGHRAFHGDTKMSTLSAILRDDPKPLSQSGAQTPRDLEKIIARCLRKDPARRFQHMDDIKIALEELKEESDSGRISEMLPAAPAIKSRAALLYAGLAVITIMAAALLFLQLRKPPAAAPGLTMRQLTQDSGLTTFPAISPDGKLIAYASTRSGEGNLDIWVQQLTRGAQPIRLTRNKADDTWPSFSPDGGQIVFASDRDGGGIYVVPSLGGEERLVLRGGFLGRPRFSPDGQWIAADTAGFYASKVLVVPAAGGSARRIAADFYSPAVPIWSPDGKKILFAGSRDQGGELDWWVAPLDGGPIVKTGAAKVIQADSLVNGAPLDWLDDYILYSTGNLWRIAISPTTFRVAEKPERLTTSSAQERFARAVPKSGGKPGEWRIVLAATQRSTGLWSLPLDANAGKALGEPVKLFHDTVGKMGPTLSADGSRLSYVFQELDGWGARVRDMKTGAETTLVRSPTAFRVRLSPDGATIAYNPSISEKETVIYLVSSSGGDSRKFCDTCGLNYDWSPDSKKIIYRTGNPMRFFTIDVASGQQTVIVADPKHQVHGVRYSPDGRWIAMQYGPGVDAPRALFVMPAHDGKAPPQTEWIPIMDRPGLHVRPWWSPDGNRLYFASTAEGPEGVWTQRLNPITKRPIGEPALVYRPEADRLQLGRMMFFGPGEGRDRLIFPMDESFGNIWMAE